MNKSISQKKLREFGILIGFVLMFFVGFILPSLNGNEFKIWKILLGIPFFTLGIFYPKLLFYPYKFWMLLGFILGWINAKLFLGIVFILVLQPIAYAMLLFGYDPLRKKNHNKKSYKEYKKIQKVDFTKIF